MPKSNNSIDDCIARSRHCIVNHRNRCECMNCFSSVSCASSLYLKHWLSLGCNPITGPVLTPNKLPQLTCIHIGKQVVHYSHHMYEMRGLFYFTRCGHRSGVKLCNLAKPCAGLTDAGSSNLRRRINNGKLPVGLTMWPNG